MLQNNDYSHHLSNKKQRDSFKNTTNPAFYKKLEKQEQLYNSLTYSCFSSLFSRAPSGSESQTLFYTDHNHRHSRANQTKNQKSPSSQFLLLLNSFDLTIHNNKIHKRVPDRLDRKSHELKYKFSSLRKKKTFQLRIFNVLRLFALYNWVWKGFKYFFHWILDHFFKRYSSNTCSNSELDNRHKTVRPWQVWNDTLKLVCFYFLFAIVQGQPKIYLQFQTKVSKTRSDTLFLNTICFQNSVCSNHFFVAVYTCRSLLNFNELLFFVILSLGDQVHL